MDSIKGFLEDEQGLEVMEYAVILGLIVVATLGLIITLGIWARDTYQSVIPLSRTP